jgi:hypothetical protein
MNALRGLDPLQWAKRKIGPFYCGPVDASPHHIVPAMFPLKMLAVFAALNVLTNRMLKVRGHTLPINRQAYLGTWCEKSLLNCHDLFPIHAFMKASSKLVSITVHATPNIEILIWLLIILMSLYPIQPML